MNVMSKLSASFTVALVTVGLTACSSGGSSNQNSVGRGCTTCRTFIASPGGDGDLGGIAGADEICEAQKTDDGTYKALIVDGVNRSSPLASGGAKDWVLYPNTTYVGTMDSIIVGTTNANAVFDTLSEGIGASPPPFTFAPPASWTGLKSDWTTSGDNCNGWTSADPAANGAVGLNGETDSDAWSDSYGSASCQYPQFIYCIEQ